MRYLLTLTKNGERTVWESDNFRSILGFIRQRVLEGAQVEKFLDTTISKPGDRKLVLAPLDRIRYDHTMAGWGHPSLIFTHGMRKDD